MSLATASSGARPPQQEHATLHSASSQQAPLQRLADVRQHAAVTSSRRQRLQLAGSGKGRRRRAAVAAATPAGAPAAAAELQAGDPGSSLELGEEQQPKLDLALAADDADVVNFFFRQYKLSARKQVRGKAARALAALQATGQEEAQLSLERDVLPKLEVLEALSPGLGWGVFRRYPEQFASPDAVESWRLLAAYLFTLGIPGEQVAALFQRHPSLFQHALERPDQLRRLFAWLRDDLGLDPRDLVRLVNRCPLVLQADVEAVLKPRVQLLVGLGLPQERIVRGVLRSPEVLGVDSGLLAAKAAFLTDEAGLAGRDVAALFVREPSALLASLDRLKETVAWLRDPEEGLGLGGDLLAKVVGKGGAVKYPRATLEARVAFWRDELGFSLAQLRVMLDRLPRLLLYPAHEPKYRLKLRFLQEELGLPLSALLTFPAYMTYSLPGRIAPRAAAARALAGRPLSLSQLATGDEAFVRWLHVSPEEYWAWEEGWRASEDAARWAGDEGKEAAAGGDAAAGLDPA